MTVGSLNTALTGLQAAQRQVDVISANIANASTPGYTRKILPQTSAVVDGISIGVRTTAIQRNVNTALQFDYYNQISASSAANVKVPYYQQIQAFHGDPNDERSIANSLQRINNDFIALADNPTSTELLSGTAAHAATFANRLNDLSALYTKMRNDAQVEMQDSVAKIEGLLETISDANRTVVTALNTGRSVAAALDQRDLAVSELSKELDVSYYTLTDGTLVVQTGDGGSVLVDYTVRDLTFSPSTLGVNTLYPDSAAGVFLDNPTTSGSNDINLTTKSLGGRLGGLIELRDEILPRYQAELDEFAQKLSQRFDEQGLRLFTDESGQVPASVNPPTNTGYSGYAQTIQINQQVLDNPSLLRLGTDGETISIGSSKVIDRIVTYTFGNTKGEAALGNVDLDATGVATVFASLGIDASAKLNGLKNIQDLVTLDADPAIIPGTQDTFSIQIGTNPAVNITIAAGHTATDLVATINTAFTPDIASISATGRLVLQSNQNITIATGTLAAEGLTALGLTAGVTTVQNPSFSIQLDDGLVTSIPIAATDTSTQLLAKLNAVAGVNASLNASGFLSITTDYGAKLKLVDTSGAPLTALGISISDIAHTPYRTDNLGSNAGITSAITSADTVVSFASRVVSSQAADGAEVTRTFDVAEVYRATLETQILNDSGVNLDEELGNLIAAQRVYGANAKMITTSIEMLQELLSAI